MANELAVMETRRAVAPIQEQLILRNQVADACRVVVSHHTVNLGGKEYLQVPGYQAVAGLVGYCTSIREVEDISGEGVRAVAACTGTDPVTGAPKEWTAEGYVGEDEPVWYGGEVIDKYGKKKVLPRRAKFAIRAMAQTRALSRVLRMAVQEYVTLVNPKLQTRLIEELEDVADWAGEERPSADDMNLLREKMQEKGVEPTYMIGKFGSAKEMTKDVFKQAMAHLQEMA